MHFLFSRRNASRICTTLRSDLELPGGIEEVKENEFLAAQPQ